LNYNTLSWLCQQLFQVVLRKCLLKQTVTLCVLFWFRVSRYQFALITSIFSPHKEMPSTSPPVCHVFIVHGPVLVTGILHTLLQRLP